MQRGYAQQQYDAANAVGDAASGELNNYTGVLNQNSRDLAAAVQGAESNVFASPAYRPQPASYADYAAAESTQFGQTLYKDASGTLYTADGNPFTPGAAGNYTAPPVDNSGYDPNAYYQYNANTGQLTTREGLPGTLSGSWMQ